MTSNLLNEVLEKYDDKTKAQILMEVQRGGVSENDPIFRLALIIYENTIHLRNAPADIKATFEYCHQQVLQNLSNYENAAARGIEAKLSEAVEQVIDNARQPNRKPKLLALSLAGLISAGLIGLGFVTGVTMENARTAKVQIDPNGNLTVEQASLLQWALSADGQYAKKLVDWNDSLRNGNCQAEVRELEVTLQYGSRLAKSGFCFLWVVPPEQRRFENAN